MTENTNREIHRRIRKTDWMKSSENALRVVHCKRRKAGREIEPELNAELARRFPTYDPTLQKFTSRKPRKVGNDWTNVSDAGLRAAYSRRCKAGRAIEPELSAELARRFPCYDRRKNIFIHDLSNKSDQELQRMFVSRCAVRRAIPPMLDMELSRRFPLYNADKDAFFTVASRTAYAYKAAREDLMARYQAAIDNGGEIDDALHAELVAVMKSRYSVKTRRLKKQPRLPLESCADRTLRMRYNLYQDKNEIPDDLNTELGRRFTDYDTNARKFISESDVVGKPVATKTDKSGCVTGFSARYVDGFNVTVKAASQTAAGNYNDVYINGKRVLHNHLGTTVQTFADGVLLGVHGTITTDEQYPSNAPVWLVYSADGRVNRWAGTEKWKGYKVYIKSIQDIPSQGLVRMVFSDNAVRLIRVDIEKRRAGTALFKINNEKTK